METRTERAETTLAAIVGVALDMAVTEGLELAERRTVEIALDLGREAAADVALMGPAGHHMDREDVLGRLPERVEVCAVVSLSAYRVARAPKAR